MSIKRKICQKTLVNMKWIKIGESSEEKRGKSLCEIGSIPVPSDKEADVSSTQEDSVVQELQSAECQLGNENPGRSLLNHDELEAKDNGVKDPHPEISETWSPFPSQPYQSKEDLPPPQHLPTKTRPFKFQWYQDFPWLHFMPSKKAVLCFVCMTAASKGLFSGSTKLNQAFLTTGFKNWNRAVDKFKIHQTGDQHMEAVCKNELEKKAPISSSLFQSCQKSQQEAREALRVIMTSIKFLGRQGLPILGHDDNDGYLMRLFELRCEDMKILKAWLHRPKSYTSREISNEICEMFAHKILRDIAVKVRSAGIFSIIVDETTDVSTNEQVSISLRFVNEYFLAEEVFLGMYKTNATTSAALIEIILDVLKRFDLSLENLCGQCYDGASNMSGRHNGVQARIQEEQPKALYVHCLNHSLNLSLQDSSRVFPLIRNTLDYVNDASVLIGRSPKRFSKFEEIARENDIESVTTLKPLCPTRWTVRVASINAILKQYDAVLDTLETLGNSSDPCSTKASGLQSQFEKSSTYFAATLCKMLFQPCEKLSNLLQKPGVTVSGTIQAAKIVREEVLDLKMDGKFKLIWEDVKPKRKGV